MTSFCNMVKSLKHIKQAFNIETNIKFSNALLSCTLSHSCFSLHILSNLFQSYLHTCTTVTVTIGKIETYLICSLSALTSALCESISWGSSPSRSWNLSSCLFCMMLSLLRVLFSCLIPSNSLTNWSISFWKNSQRNK